MFPKKILKSTPHAPGVYLMLDKGASPLYVGKAKDLHKRLSSYARHSDTTLNKTGIMLSKVTRVDTIITNTEKEALILEASLIKKHKPRYNIILRDDKNYPLIKVTVQEKWPRVFMTRKKARDNARYFGPYSSSSRMWATLNLITGLFPLRTCKGTVLKPRKRPCLNHQLGKCMAPCAGKADRDLYQANVKNIVMILEGRNRELISTLKKKMDQAAAQLEFEKAALYRDQIRALTLTMEKQLVVSQKDSNQDVFGLVRQGAAVSVAVIFIRNGVMIGSRSFFLADPYGDDQVILAQVINQYYDPASFLPPRELLLPLVPEQQSVLQEKLTDMSGSRVFLTIPKRGDKAALISMARQNAENVFAEKEKKDKSWESLSKSIMKKLRLNRVPETIECLDISNISGKQAVGSLVCFRKGEPSKKDFRHYSIKTVEGPDDYGMMREVITRRFTRGIEEDNLPDLFLVDGGKGQLGVASSVARELGLERTQELMGIAKERENEGEKLYKPGRKNPVTLPFHDPVLLYFMRIRDESHRFGITFHRKKRNKTALTSTIEKIPDIGKDRKHKLLSHFGSVKRVREATRRELCEVSGIGPETAEKIFGYFHPKDE